MNIPLAIQCAEQIAALYRKAASPTISEPSTDTQVQVLVDGSTAQIIFPGTASLVDVRTDAMIRKMPWLHHGKVHRGFMAAYCSVAQAIINQLGTARQLTIAGHSLGGALATLCAHDLRTLKFEVRDVFTYGSPRVGNVLFAGTYNSHLADRTTRIVNARDPVPHVPFVWGTYRHVDTQHYLTTDFQLVVDSPVSVAVSEFEQTATAALAGHAASAALHLAAPHHIESYLGKLKGLP